MEKQFPPTVYNGCDYLSMLRLQLNNVSKSGPRSKHKFRFINTVSNFDCFMSWSIRCYPVIRDSDVPKPFGIFKLCATCHWEFILPHASSSSNYYSGQFYMYRFMDCFSQQNFTHWIYLKINISTFYTVSSPHTPLPSLRKQHVSNTLISKH